MSKIFPAVATLWSRNTRTLLPAAAALLLFGGAVFAVVPVPQFLPYQGDGWWPTVDECNQFAQIADDLYIEYAKDYCPVSRAARWSGKQSTYFQFCRSHNLGDDRAELKAMTDAINHCLDVKMRRVKSRASDVPKVDNTVRGVAGPGLLERNQSLPAQGGPAATGVPSAPPGGAPVNPNMGR
jgi:hypothetical protein